MQEGGPGLRDAFDYHTPVQRLLFIYLFIIYHLFVFLQMTLLPGSAQKTYGFWADIWFTCRLKKL